MIGNRGTHPARTRRMLGCVLALAALVPASAAAQETGTRLKPGAAHIDQRAGTDADRARTTMLNYAACMLQRSRTRARNYLATFPGSLEANRAVRSLVEDECMGSGELGFSENLFRGALYEAIYRDEFDKDPADLRLAPPIDYAQGNDPANPVVRNLIALRNFGDCVTRADPDNARHLVLSNSASADERAVFAALQPRFETCLVAGTTINFSKAVLRGTISETLYRISRAATDSPLPTTAN